jgi:hypothetical protein
VLNCDKFDIKCDKSGSKGYQGQNIYDKYGKPPSYNGVSQELGWGLDCGFGCGLGCDQIRGLLELTGCIFKYISSGKFHERSEHELWPCKNFG